MSVTESESPVQESSVLKLVVDPLLHILKGKALKRYNENVDGIRDRFAAEHLTLRRNALGRDLNCIDLDEMHFEDPAFGTTDFPKGVLCRKCSIPIEKAMVSLVITDDGTFLEKEGVRVERGNVRVVLQNGHYIPEFFCESCRWTEELQGHYRNHKGEMKPMSFKLPKSAHPSSFRHASNKAKRLNNQLPPRK